MTTPEGKRVKEEAAKNTAEGRAEKILQIRFSQLQFKDEAPEDALKAWIDKGYAQRFKEHMDGLRTSKVEAMNAQYKELLRAASSPEAEGTIRTLLGNLQPGN